MSDKKLTPDIRFSGFDESWEEKNLGDIATAFEYGLNVAAKEYDGKNKYLRITDIDDVSRIFKCDNISSPDIDIDKCQDYRLEKDNILFARTGASVGKSYIYKETDGVVYFAGFLIRTRIKPEYNANFVFQNTLTSKYEKYIQITSQRSGQPGVNAQEYSHYPLLLPIFDEQTQIGTFFTHLDALITLNQRKYDKLISLKKSMLQKMFPRNGTDVPEIRFAGFEEPWKKQRFGDVFTEYSEKNHEELPALTIIQGSGTIYRDSSDRNLQYNKKSLSSYKMVNKGDFIVHLRSFEGGLEVATLDGIISPAYHTFHGENTDSRFFYAFFRSSFFINVLLKPHVYGIRDGRSIDIEGMKSIFIPMPSFKEQKAIGDFLENIDRLITLQQCKIEKLKQLKKSLLEKMFV